MAYAEFSEIRVAQRKDEDNLRKMREQLSDLIRSIFGERMLIKYYSLIPTITSFSYLASTNLLNLQTLGEDYAGLIQTVNNELPSIWRRILHIGVDVFLDDLIYQLNRAVQKYPSMASLLNFLSFTSISGLFEAIFLIIRSKNHSFGKSMAGISYLCIRPQQNLFPSTLQFLISISIILQFFTLTLFIFRTETRIQDAELSNVTKKRNECRICSSSRQMVTLPCGHISCIACISDFIDTRLEMIKCAYCRQKFPLNRTIPLLNL